MRKVVIDSVIDTMIDLVIDNRFVEWFYSAKQTLRIFYLLDWHWHRIWVNQERSDACNTYVLWLQHVRLMAVTRTSYGCKAYVLWLQAVRFVALSRTDYGPKCMDLWPEVHGPMAWSAWAFTGLVHTCLIFFLRHYTLPSFSSWGTTHFPQMLPARLHSRFYNHFTILYTE